MPPLGQILNNAQRWAWLALAIILVVFHIGITFYGLVPNLVSRPIHLALLLPFALIYAAPEGRAKWVGAILALAGVLAAGWVALNHDALINQYGFIDNTFQIWLSVILLLIILETARRAVGWPLPLIAALALGYGLLGHHIPGRLGHSGTPIESLLGNLVIAEGGIWGSLTGISVNMVSVFVIFGAFLNAGEAGQGFMNVASFAAGRLKGGAAKVSLLSSALFGSISGTATANVASTGAITLPAMTRLGYPKRLSAAVEAVASSGGQIMPPLMGAGAFVMVELTGVSYNMIIMAALPPAFLYFFTVWIGINGYAARNDLKAIAEEDRPSVRAVIITSAFFAVPFAVLLGCLFAIGFTPEYSAAIATMVAFGLLFINADLQFRPRDTALRLEGAFLAASLQVAMIGSVIICASIIVGVLAVTGLGVKVTSLILSVGSGGIWTALLLTAIACLVLGMEIPTTAAYVICVSVAGPALIQLGLEPLQAHLFVFWFALLSTITPPVCGAVFIAAGMVGENWLKVALSAMALGVGLYIIPLGMIANPDILSLASDPWMALLALVKMGVGLYLVSHGVIAARRIFLRVLLISLGIALLFVSL